MQDLIFNTTGEARRESIWLEVRKCGPSAVWAMLLDHLSAIICHIPAKYEDNFIAPLMTDGPDIPPF